MIRKLFLGGLLLAGGLPCLHADSLTPRMGLTKPSIGSTGWGTKTNTDWDIVDTSAAILGKSNTFTSTNTFSVSPVFSSLSNGQIIFPISGTLSGSSSFFWNSTNSFLGIGTSSPSTLLHIVGGTVTVTGSGASISVSGPVTASTFTGSGSGLTSISGNSVSGGTFGAVDGSALTALNASNISSGNLGDARLSANVPLLNTANIFSSSNTFNGHAIFPSANIGYLPYIGSNSILTFLSTGTAGYVLESGGSGAPSWVDSSSFGNVSGSGSSGQVALWNGVSSITGISAFTTSGNNLTVTGEVIASTLTGVAFTGTGTGDAFFASASTQTKIGVSTSTVVMIVSTNGLTLNGSDLNTASGLVQLDSSTRYPALSGINITNLNATNLASGSVADARLSANVPLLNAANTFSVTGNIFTGTTTLPIASISSGTLGMGTINSSLGVGVGAPSSGGSGVTLIASESRASPGSNTNTGILVGKTAGSLDRTDLQLWNDSSHILLHAVQGSGNSDSTYLGTSSADDALSLFQGAGNAWKILTYNSVPIIFGTNNTERMRLPAGGGLQIGSSGNAVNAIYRGSGSVDFGATTGGTCDDLTISVSNAADGDEVFLGIPNALASSDASAFFPQGWVSASGTVTIRRCCDKLVGNCTDPSAATVKATVFH